jgi:hypothetical protein
MISIHNPNKPNRWYSRKWTKIQIAVNENEWKDFKGFDWLLEKANVRTRIVSYIPTIQDRIKALIG